MSRVPAARPTRRTGRVAATLPGPDDSTDSTDAMPTPDTSSAAGGSQYSAALAFTNAPSLPTLSQASSRTRRSSPSKNTRNRSPTKVVRTPADLRLAQIPIVPVVLKTNRQIPTSLSGLFNNLKAIIHGRATVPKQLHSQITDTLRLQDPEIEPAWLVDKEAYPVQEAALVIAEFEQLKRIAVLSEECALEGAPEVVWNESVHSRLLDIALAPRWGALRHRNVTTVDICSEYLLPVGNADAVSASGASSAAAAAAAAESVVTAQTTTLQTKRVDYVILLDDEQVVSEAERVIREALSCSPAAGVQSINHVDQAFLRSRPIAVSIETKTLDGGELHGRTQLSIWGAAHIMRLRAAIGAGTDTSADALEQIALPLVLVVGSKWSVYFLIDHGDKMHMMEALSLDDTSSVLGCYKVLALLRELGRWSLEVYRPWFRRAVLCSDDNV